MMKTSFSRRHPSGYISIVLVLAVGTVLSILMIYAFRRAVESQAIQGQVQLRVDYAEKEEAILRSIVAITPNRAILAMQSGSNASSTVSDPLRWQNIFTESLDAANARSSIPSNLLTSLNIANLKSANLGDSALGTPSTIFSAISPDTGYASAGINRSLGTGYPVPLTSSDSTTTTRDASYPIISSYKAYGTLAQSGVGLPVATYPNFNILPYPQINFGYATPGSNFVAKRNWWAFSMNVADHDDALTYLANVRRNFVLSIYEIPSQLAISSSAFMSLGQYASGSAWQNVTIDGGMFVGKADVQGTTALSALSSRRGMTLSTGTTIGGQSFTSSPFSPGVRESYQVTTGPFFPVSLASESGRAAFVPINRGSDYFDRFSQTTESNVLSTTTWNNYTIGALQCAMQLDVTQVQSVSNSTPTMLRFAYYLASGARASMNIPLTSAIQTTLPAGYVKVADEGDSYTFSSTVPVDIAYGTSGGYIFKQGVTGTIKFNNATLGDPLPSSGTHSSGYWRPASPFAIIALPSGQNCVTVYPQRIPAFLTNISAATSAVNNSLVVNVDYSVTGLNNPAKKPSIPCTLNDYGCILRECANLTSFTKGFSLVTNLRLYIGDDFNNVATAPPTGYTPAVTLTNPGGLYFPPCSLFAPEKRYGTDVDPFSVVLTGQIGSLASDTITTAIRPLESKTLNGYTLGATQVTVNLRPILHPADLPPISMMNWLVVLEERNKDFY